MRRASAHSSIALAVTGALALAACKPQADDSRAETARAFPTADRPVSGVVSNAFSNEEERDRLGEADMVMNLAGISPGMSVADIGAGEGYYTVRLAERVGERGRVLAQDIDGDALRKLGARVEHDRLDNVSIKPGGEDDPRLPERSFDRVLMIHRYMWIISTRSPSPMRSSGGCGRR
jgi:predicted methyltransferase